MPAEPIRVKGIRVFPQKAAANPGFGERTVLVRDPWDYVELSLRRSSQTKALFYWRQSRAFAHATESLDKLASPLTAYYSVLNAAKALLSCSKQAFSPYHGLSGRSVRRASLANEHILVKSKGVLPGLLSYYGISSPNGLPFTLKDVFYNLPFIHRAFCSTFKSSEEIFLPIRDPHFVCKSGSTEAWFCFSIRDQRLHTDQTVRSLDGFERDLSVGDDFVMRQKKRFKWNPTVSESAALEKLRKVHLKLRLRCVYISGLTRLWYIKKSRPSKGQLELPTLCLMFMALHRISELSRYTPQRLDSLFGSNANWVLSEFLGLVLPQFIDECAAEITAHDIMPPGIHLS